MNSQTLYSVSQLYEESDRIGQKLSAILYQKVKLAEFRNAVQLKKCDVDGYVKVFNAITSQSRRSTFVNGVLKKFCYILFCKFQTPIVN